MDDEANSLADMLCANMNDLVSSFWNKIMREYGLETWTVGDTLSELPSPLEKLLKTPMEVLEQDGGTPISEEEIPPIRPEDEPSELHSIDSFTDNEQFDEIFAGVVSESPDGSSSDNGNDCRIIEPDVVDIESSSAGEEFSDQLGEENSVLMEESENSESNEQNSFEKKMTDEAGELDQANNTTDPVRPALGLKRSHDEDRRIPQPKTSTNHDTFPFWMFTSHDSHELNRNGLKPKLRKFSSRFKT